VQRSVESAAPSSADVQQSVFASIDSVAAFSATAAREHEQSRQQVPRLAELQVSSTSAGKTSVASKKKLMSRAFQVQKQRHDAAVAAAAAAVTAAEVCSNADTVSSSDTDTSPARGRDDHSSTSTYVTSEQPSVDGRQPQTDNSHISEQCDAASFPPTTKSGCQLYDSVAADDADGALLVRSVGAVDMPPKALTPAKALPVSLVTTAADPDDHHHSIDVLSSPIKLVPPADPQHIDAIVAADIPSMTSAETTQPDTEDTEEQ